MSEPERERERETHVGSTLIALARDRQGDILNTQTNVTRSE